MEEIETTLGVKTCTTLIIDDNLNEEYAKSQKISKRVVIIPLPNPI
jgi:hypothetical protein